MVDSVGFRSFHALVKDGRPEAAQGDQAMRTIPPRWRSRRRRSREVHDYFKV